MNISLRSYFMSRSSQKSKPFLGGNIFHYSDHLLRFWVILAKTVGAYDSYLLCHFHRRCLRCFQPSFSFVKFIQLLFHFLFLCALPKLQLQQLFFHPFLYWIRFRPKLPWPIRSSLSNHSREDANKFFWVSGRTLVYARSYS